MITPGLGRDGSREVGQNFKLLPCDSVKLKVSLQVRELNQHLQPLTCRITIMTWRTCTRVSGVKVRQVTMATRLIERRRDFNIGY